MVNAVLYLLAGLHLLSAATAQQEQQIDAEGTPVCATTCIDTAASAIGCDASNLACGCSNSSFVLAANRCMASACEAEKLRKGVQALQAMCGGSTGPPALPAPGIPAPPTLGNTSTAASSTGEHPTSSTRAALPSSSQRASSSSSPSSTSSTTLTPLTSVGEIGTTLVIPAPVPSGTPGANATEVVLSTSSGPVGPVPTGNAARGAVWAGRGGWWGGVVVGLGFVVF